MKPRKNYGFKYCSMVFSMLITAPSLRNFPILFYFHYSKPYELQFPAKTIITGLTTL